MKFSWRYDDVSKEWIVYLDGVEYVRHRDLDRALALAEKKYRESKQ